MLIIGTDDPEGLEKMADMAGEARGAEYPLVGVPMVCENGKWLDWMPPPGPSATGEDCAEQQQGEPRCGPTVECGGEPGEPLAGRGYQVREHHGGGSVRVSGWCGNRHRPGRATLVYSMIGKQRGVKMDAARAELRDVLLRRQIADLTARQ